jgi:hypothetical protein
MAAHPSGLYLQQPQIPSWNYIIKLAPQFPYSIYSFRWHSNWLSGHVWTDTAARYYDYIRYSHLKSLQIVGR